MQGQTNNISKQNKAQNQDSIFEDRVGLTYTALFLPLLSEGNKTS